MVPYRTRRVTYVTRTLDEVGVAHKLLNQHRLIPSARTENLHPTPCGTLRNMAATLPAYSVLSPPAAPPLYSREIEGEAAPGEHPPSTPGEPPSDHGQYDQPPSLLNQDVSE